MRRCWSARRPLLRSDVFGPPGPGADQASDLHGCRSLDTRALVAWVIRFPSSRPGFVDYEACELRNPGLWPGSDPRLRPRSANASSACWTIPCSTSGFPALGLGAHSIPLAIVWGFPVTLGVLLVVGVAGAWLGPWVGDAAQPTSVLLSRVVGPRSSSSWSTSRSSSPSLDRARRACSRRRGSCSPPWRRWSARQSGGDVRRCSAQPQGCLPPGH